ncbi:MAG: lipid II:glycine glycyltransferase FemX [Planctomycetaceae bacterium]
MGSPARALDHPPRSPGLKVVRALEAGPWEAFVGRHPDASVFHTPAMAQVFAETERHTPAVWAATDDAGAVRALMTPVTVATLGGPLRTLTSRTVSFAAPIAEPGDDEALRALLSAYRAAGSRGSLFTEVRHHVVDPSVSAALQAEGFAREAHLNFTIDLTRGEEALWGAVASSARRNVQKARRSGVAIEETADPSAVADAYDVLRDVYHRIQVPLPDRSLFDASARILGPLGMFSMLLARWEDRTIGVLCLLRHRGVVTYWYTGTLREHATLRAGDLLAWHAIATEAAAGNRVFDFGGAGRPDEPYGVRDFKAKYGGDLIEPGRAIWTPSPLRYRASTAGYELVRRFL